MSQETPPRTPRCRLPDAPDYRGVEIVRLAPVPTPADYLAAMALANAEADRRLGEGCHMLLSWYDRDRDFESP